MSDSGNGPKDSSRTHARHTYLGLAAPKPKPDLGDLDRDQWISKVCSQFVSHSTANKGYYRAVLERLWPRGHGIPGPIITEKELREAIDLYRKSIGGNESEYEPYRDPFRRIRELQGEEGVVGIARVGRRCQLVHLNVAKKRIPRSPLDDKDWAIVLGNYKGVCAVCGRREPTVHFQQDHKIPRVRGGGDELSNWQPLCDECNNFKSTACRGCNIDCSQCAWAFPEKLAPLRVSSENIAKARAFALKNGIDPHKFVNYILGKYLPK